MFGGSCHLRMIPFFTTYGQTTSSFSFFESSPRPSKVTVTYYLRLLKPDCVFSLFTSSAKIALRTVFFMNYLYIAKAAGSGSESLKTQIESQWLGEGAIINGYCGQEKRRE